MKKIFFLCFILILSNSYAYEGLLFKPLTANPYEARMGSFYQFSEEKLRLDIGASFDLTDFKIGDESELRLGTDWFTNTRIRSEGKFKFPVETTDYYFGVNSSLKTKIAGRDIYARLRLAHISSHLIDGYAKGTVFNKEPFVYSREFFDLCLAYPIYDARIYLGMTYVFSTIPDDVNLFVPQIGIDLQTEICPLIDLTAGVDQRLAISSTKVNTAAQAGLLFKLSKKVGVSLNLYYYSGNSMHGMFNMDDEDYFGLGFQVNYY